MNTDKKHYHHLKLQWIIFIGCIIISLPSMAQREEDPWHKDNIHIIEEKIATLNQYLQGTETDLTLKKHYIIAEFKKNGETYRIDQFHLEALDPKEIKYSEEEEAVIINCLESPSGKLKKYEDGCIQREIIKTGTIRAYHRINFSLGSDTDKINGFINTFEELVLIFENQRDEQH